MNPDLIHIPWEYNDLVQTKARRRIGFNGEAGSAELHSAVSRIFNPHSDSPKSGRIRTAGRLAESNSAVRQISNLRYSLRPHGAWFPAYTLILQESGIDKLGKVEPDKLRNDHTQSIFCSNPSITV